MKKAIVLACLVLAGSANAVTTMGVRSCGQWAEARQARDVRETATEAWLVGYLTGMAVASERDVLAKPDGSSLYLWMDKYCRENPLKGIDNGGRELFDVLLKQ